MANEKRLIDANSIKYHEHRECGGHGLYFTTKTVCKEDIDKMPTVNAAEVAHGRWKFVDLDGWWFNECSICGVMTPNYDGSPPDWNYCPNCGAKMDGGLNDE